jgi:hypothetical protein
LIDAKLILGVLELLLDFFKALFTLMTEVVIFPGADAAAFGRGILGVVATAVANAAAGF